jgi:hypothetical protein
MPYCTEDHGNGQPKSWPIEGKDTDLACPEHGPGEHVKIGKRDRKRAKELGIDLDALLAGNNTGKGESADAAPPEGGEPDA